MKCLSYLLEDTLKSLNLNSYISNHCYAVHGSIKLIIGIFSRCHQTSLTFWLWPRRKPSPTRWESAACVPETAAPQSCRLWCTGDRGMPTRNSACPALSSHSRKAMLLQHMKGFQVINFRKAWIESAWESLRPRLARICENILPYVSQMSLKF